MFFILVIQKYTNIFCPYEKFRYNQMCPILYEIRRRFCTSYNILYLTLFGQKLYIFSSDDFQVTPKHLRSQHCIIYDRARCQIKFLGLFIWLRSSDTHTHTHTHTHTYHHHHHIALVARISLTLSRHSSLSFIALGRSSGQQPVSSHSCWMYVRAGRPAFARPCVGIHKSTSLMSSFLLLQQCPACLVLLTWIVFVIGGRWRTVGVLWGVTARTCSGLHAAFLCNCHLASSPAVLLASM